MRKNRFWWSGGLAVTAVMTLAAQNPDDLSSSVVRITTPVRQGSGIVVTAEREFVTILTMYHVLAGAERYDVVFAGASDRGPFQATVKDVVNWQTSDETYGLAAFRVRGAIPPGVRAVASGDGTSVQRGESLVYWGYPNRTTVLRRVETRLSAQEGTVLVVDRSLGEGASGGPITRHGKIVGLAAARDQQESHGVMWEVAALALRGWGIKVPDALRPGEVFTDCADCPEMVVIPQGTFTMGSGRNEVDEQGADEGPVREVAVASFAMGKYEVSRAQFESYVAANGPTGSGCRLWNGPSSEVSANDWQSPGFKQSASEPVVCVSWNDANGFVRWLGERTGQAYRLPSEAEWEYAARAGTTTRRYWGNGPAAACDFENVADESVPFKAGWTKHNCPDGYIYTAPGGRFKPNAFGLYDMLANVVEWTADCANDSYDGAPRTGEPWLKGDCSRRMLRGGAWLTAPRNTRSAARARNVTTVRADSVGFRVAKTLK
jgi:formylglycine-generating enzyme required for sulfatase activity